jgi:hypothetical protein
MLSNDLEDPSSSWQVWRQLDPRFLTSRFRAPSRGFESGACHDRYMQLWSGGLSAGGTRQRGMPLAVDCVKPQRSRRAPNRVATR